MVYNNHELKAVLFFIVAVHLLIHGENNENLVKIHGSSDGISFFGIHVGSSLASFKRVVLAIKVVVIIKTSVYPDIPASFKR